MTDEAEAVPTADIQHEEPAESEPPQQPDPAAAEEPLGEVVPVESGAAEDVLPEVVPADARIRGVAGWPFAVYFGLWAAFAGVLVWRFLQIPQDVAVLDASAYQVSVLGGLTLAMGGPLLVLVAWKSSWGAPGWTKGGLFVSALVMGSVATFGGMSLWWLALVLVDQLRLGRVL